VSVAAVNTVQYTRASVIAAFENSWLLTEALFSALQGEAVFSLKQYHNLRHPLIFYYAHPAVLYLMKMRVAGLIPLLEDPVQIAFEQQFETGVDEMSWDDMSKNEGHWPRVREVTEFRRKAFAQIRGVLERSELLDGRPISQDSPMWSVVMGITHEAIHFETSSVLMRELPLKFFRAPPYLAPPHPSARAASAHVPVRGADFPASRLVDVPETTVELGKPADYPSFGWDNEYGTKKRTVPAFAASDMLTSNGDFFEFVAAGGYRERKFWTDDGWAWRSYRNVKWPTWWVASGPAGAQKYHLRTLFEVVPMPWSWPVEVNMYEAEAYCAWRSARDGVALGIMNEAQHHAMRPARTPADNAAVDLALRMPSTEIAKHRNTNLAFGSGSPVDLYPPSAAGFRDTFGNVWQYCSNVIEGLDGFKVHPYYEDFTMPCIDGKHYVILGGSFISRDDLTSPFARYHFRKHFFQHCGFRVVTLPKAPGAAAAAASDAAATPKTVHRSGELDQEGRHKYESTEQLQQYLALHYGDVSIQMPSALATSPVMRSFAHFPQRVARRVAEVASNAGARPERALDVGCSVGGTTFELARYFTDVVGIDYSSSFIDVCNQLRTTGKVQFQVRGEGDRLLPPQFTATLPSLVDPRRTRFEVGDACNLDPRSLGQFDAVLAANLLCRLPDPAAFLAVLRDLVRPGGVLIFTSPFSWLPQYTPRAKWLGGRFEDRDSATSSSALQAHLSPHFELVSDTQDLPFIMREHPCKYQFITPHVLTFKRK
jgi:5-histidylcysteine sulfoxide synthase/putative 4-mercaptohistidine N1-methyltranferase